LDRLCEERRELVEVIGSRFADLGDDLIPVGDEHSHALPSQPDVCTEVVLEVLDPDPLDCLHARSVATRSYFVKPDD
jgi:hypothetical protein